MKLKLMVILASLYATTAFAAASADAPGEPCEGLKVATGPRDKVTGKGKGYSRLFDDMKKVCSDRVALCEVPTKGGLDNLNALSTKDADVGMAQVDTVNDMKNGDENIAALQVVLPLNSNFLHVVTYAPGFTIAGEKKWMGMSKEADKVVVINRVSDLRGQRVATVGSATLVMSKLDKATGLGLQIIEAKDDAAAFAMVKAGQVAAAISVSGWPSGTVQTLSQNDGYTMVPFDAQALQNYTVKPINYKNLGVYNNNAMAAPNVLLTRPFQGEKAAEVAKLRQCLLDNLTNLKEGSFAPGWNEIKDIGLSYDLPKFQGPKVVSKKK